MFGSIINSVLKQRDSTFIKVCPLIHSIKMCSLDLVHPLFFFFSLYKRDKRRQDQIIFSILSSISDLSIGGIASSYASVLFSPVLSPYRSKILNLLRPQWWSTSQGFSWQPTFLDSSGRLTSLDSSGRSTSRDYNDNQSPEALVESPSEWTCTD